MGAKREEQDGQIRGEKWGEGTTDVHRGREMGIRWREKTEADGRAREVQGEDRGRLGKREKWRGKTEADWGRERSGGGRLRQTGTKRSGRED